MKAILGKRLIMASALIASVAVVGAVVVLRMNSSGGGRVAPSGSESENASPAEAVSEPVSMRRLVGRWLRTDSPYIIEIHEVSPDGTLRAGYYNPRAINVAAAKAENKNGKIEVFVELHDAGYPGSNYALKHNPQTDSLEGTYFQAGLQQKFEVAFMRMPEQR